MIELQLGNLLKAKSYTLATAESCTGGLIGHRITNVSGSSAYYLGGIISYSNEAKMQFLGVQESTLRDFGAVSEQTAREMALGAQRIFGATFALSVTGIAGPDGGTADKPVGLTYIGLATPTTILVRRFVWTGERIQNKEASAEAALQFLLEYLHDATLSR